MHLDRRLGIATLCVVMFGAGFVLRTLPARAQQDSSYHVHIPSYKESEFIHSLAIMMQARRSLNRITTDLYGRKHQALQHLDEAISDIRSGLRLIPR